LWAVTQGSDRPAESAKAPLKRAAIILIIVITRAGPLCLVSPFVTSDRIEFGAVQATAP